MKNNPENNWYSFHFGSDFVNNNQHLPDYFGKSFNNCYILFADFCNFTRFFSASESLEDIEPILREYYTEVRKSIHKNKGMLDKILGDGFLAVWGLHECTGKTEKNILQCVTELNSIGLTIAHKWQSQIDVYIQDIGMRFGVAKGRLITIQRNETYPGLSILGDGINMSSRLQGIANPSELVCSNKAYKVLSNYSEGFTENATDINIKGFGMVKLYTIDINEIKIT